MSSADAWLDMFAMPPGDHRFLVREYRDTQGVRQIGYWSGRNYRAAPVAEDARPLVIVPAEQRPIASAVAELLIDILGCQRERVTDDAMLVDDLGADSLDLVELQIELDERLGIETADDAYPVIMRIADVHRIICGEGGRA